MKISMGLCIARQLLVWSIVMTVSSIAAAPNLRKAKKVFYDDFTDPEKTAKLWKGEYGNTLKAEDGKAVVKYKHDWGTVGMRDFLSVDLSKKVYVEFTPVSASRLWVVKMWDDKKHQYHIGETNKFLPQRMLLNNVVNQYDGKFRFKLMLGGSQFVGGTAKYDSVTVYQTDQPIKNSNVSLLHYRPPGKGKYGDAIPFYHDGVYHVYYLLDGYGLLTWEHLTSKDLVHWQEHPQALDHGPKGSPSGGGLGTGSVVWDPKTKMFYLFYTGFNAANSLKKAKPGQGHIDGGQQIMIATGTDTINWTKHPDKTFVGDGVQYHNISKGPFVSGNHTFRDPYVRWNEEEKVWDMVFLAETAKEKGQRPVYGRAISKNLMDWKQVEPIKDAPPHDCPDIFQMGDTWYLVKGHSWWQRSSSPTGPYTKELQFDTDVHAVPKRMFDGKRHILVGWLRDTGGGTDESALIWGGFQCIPREIYRGPGKHLCSKPVDEVVNLFKKTIQEGKDLKLTAPISFDVPDDYMVEMTLKIAKKGGDGDPECSIVFRDQKKAKPTGYPLELKPNQKKAKITMSSAYSWERECPTVDWNGEIKVRAFVTNSIIECFVDDAEAFSIRAYDFCEGALTIIPRNAVVEIKSLKVKVLPPDFKGVTIRNPERWKKSK